MFVCLYNTEHTKLSQFHGLDLFSVVNTYLLTFSFKPPWKNWIVEKFCCDEIANLMYVCLKLFETPFYNSKSTSIDVCYIRVTDSYRLRNKRVVISDAM